jgi:hypothetical protein
MFMVEKCVRKKLFEKLRRKFVFLVFGFLKNRAVTLRFGFTVNRLVFGVSLNLLCFESHAETSGRWTNAVRDF